MANKSLVVENPATGEAIGEAAAFTAEQIPAVIAKADAAQKQWAKTPPRERGEVLRACWAAMLEQKDEIAAVITSENGKPLRDALGEVAYAAEFFRWNSEEAVRLDGDVGDLPNGSGRKIVLRQPVGTVLAVTPWNFPAAMLTRKLAPALAAGCAVVAKPASATPLTAVKLADVFRAAGLPDGLLHVVPTLDTGGVVRAALAQAPVRKLSFTGSTEVGSKLLEQAAARVVSCAMELGGNAPFIVLGDADIDEAIDAALVAKLRHNSETCTAANRFYVAEPIAAAFTDALVARFEKLVLGDGADDATDHGPLIDRGATETVGALVRAAVDHGATAVTGGSALDRPGAFFAPTVLTNVAPDNPILQEEIFGPVAPIVTVPDDDDAILALANDCEVGLAGYVCGGDFGRALSVAERLEVGMVGLNRGIVSDPATPFGGVKQSGIGREGGHEGVLAFTEAKLIVTSW
ncbi:MAG: succinate-semialdehyde dehydrogenase / glutarate-semialdehyde dehydrogenase [Actinomycetota bacterium]|jgi:succinate-semialdehyde dehydrogenase/glutarate-semialdehyde dehydrogenase